MANIIRIILMGLTDLFLRLPRAASVSILVVLTVSTACAASTDPDASSETTATESLNSARPIGSDIFFEYAQVTSFDAVPMTAREVLDNSSIVVIGSVRTVKDGFVLGDEGPTATYHMVLHIDVAEVVKGPELDSMPKTVFVSLQRPREISAEHYAELTPTVPYLFALVPKDERDLPGRPVQRAGAGRPAGTPLHQLASPLGLVGYDDKSIVTPLADELPLEVVGTDIVQRLARHVGAASRGRIEDPHWHTSPSASGSGSIPGTAPRSSTAR